MPSTRIRYRSSLYGNSTTDASISVSSSRRSRIGRLRRKESKTTQEEPTAVRPEAAAPTAALAPKSATAEPLKRPPIVRRMTSGTLGNDEQIRLDNSPTKELELCNDNNSHQDHHQDQKQQDKRAIKSSNNSYVFTCPSTSDTEDDPAGLDGSSISSIEGDHTMGNQQKQQLAAARRKADPEAMKVQEIFKTFSELDKETAARISSWKYYKEIGQRSDAGDNSKDISSHAPYFSTSATTSRRDALARAMIQRYISCESDVTVACQNVHATLQGWRDEKVDWVRTAWHEEQHWSPERIEFSGMVRAKMSRWLGPQGRVCILDYDDEDRCNFYHKLNISTSGTRYFREGILYAASYMLEKAIACSERRSNGRQTQINVVLDYREVNMRDKEKTLPISIALEIADLMKHHHPGRLYNITMIDAPFLARFAWPIFRPFVSNIVQGGVRFVTGKRQLLKTYGPKLLYDRASNLDMDKFYQLPFDQAYEDVHGSALEY